MENKIPDDLMQCLKNAFTDDPASLARVIFFLSDCISKDIANPFITSLQSVMSIETVFKQVAERMAEDTKTAEKDPQYRQLMYDVWNNFLKDTMTAHPDNGQRWELAILSKDNCDGTVAQICFMRAVAHLPPDMFKAVATVVSKISGPVAKYGGAGLTFAKKAQTLVTVSLVVVHLAISVIKNIKRWWKGEITGKRCVKNIIDSGVSVAAGIGGVIGGEILGATIGSVFGPIGTGVGAIVGAVVGGGVGTKAAETLCDRLTQWMFGLPKSEALENAYNFLGVSPKASNSDVNSQYRRLALQYHPDKGGDAEKWTRLQYSMAVIRESRGEP